MAFFEFTLKYVLGQDFAGQGFAGQDFAGQDFAGQGFAGQGFAQTPSSGYCTKHSN